MAHALRATAAAVARTSLRRAVAPAAIRPPAAFRQMASLANASNRTGDGRRAGERLHIQANRCCGSLAGVASCPPAAEGLTDEQREFQRIARDFADREMAPRMAQWDETETLPVDILRQLAELGFGGACRPQRRGGSCHVRPKQQPRRPVGWARLQASTSATTLAGRS